MSSFTGFSGARPALTATRPAGRVASPRRRRAGAAGLAALLITLVIAPAADAAPAGPTGRGDVALTPQLEPLSFLQGRWRCRLTHVSDPDNPVTQFYTVRPIFDGNWLEMNAFQPADETRPTAVASRTTIGWNPLTGMYVQYFQDNRNNQGSGTAPAVDAGHVRFTSNLIVNGRAASFMDDFENVDRQHFVDNFAVLRNGTWTPAGVLECARSRA